MKKILVPMDFSSPSLEAFQFAVNLANKSGGSITVLHVVDLPIVAYGASIDIPVYTYDLALLKDLKQSAKRKFEQIMAKYAKGFKRVKFSVGQGPTFPVIRDHVKNKRYDLVVMGTHGASGLKEFFIGSNTEKVVRFAKAPVLAIRKAKPVSSIKNIVFPTSLQEGQTEFINKLRELQKFFGARLHVLYLNTPFNFIRDHELQDFAKRHQLKNYTLNIRNDRYEPDGIISFAKEVKADLLAMPTHARKGLSHFMSGSITEDVVNHAPYPIWTYAIRS
jgi:nucleotide-binding universal stress UspA family protein